MSEQEQLDAKSRLAVLRARAAQRGPIDENLSAESAVDDATIAAFLPYQIRAVYEFEDDAMEERT